MNIRTVAAADLSSEEIRLWLEIQQRHSHLASPFFRPEFTAAAAEVCQGVRVAVLEENGAPAAFFPFQMGDWGSSTPIAVQVSGYHGLIAAPEFKVDPLELLRGCGLKSWDFWSMPVSENFAPYAMGSGICSLVNVADFRDRKIHGQKRRKLDREAGPLRFDPDCRDPAVLDQLLCWKRNRYRQAGIADIFRRRWARPLLERIWSQRSTDFCGLLSVLYAGNEIAALHFGMRTRDHWHCWFPAFNPKFARYSPGLLLFLEMIAAAPDLGIGQIDLGIGQEEYKRRIRTATFPVQRGTVSLSISHQRWRSLYRRLRPMLLKSPLGRPVHAAYCWLKS